MFSFDGIQKDKGKKETSLQWTMPKTILSLTRELERLQRHKRIFCFQVIKRKKLEKTNGESQSDLSPYFTNFVLFAHSVSTTKRHLPSENNASNVFLRTSYDTYTSSTYGKNDASLYLKTLHGMEQKFNSIGLNKYQPRMIYLL